MEGKIRKDEAAWKKQLTQNQYFVTRNKGTEPPFTGEYEDTETAGTYKCVCCASRCFILIQNTTQAADGPVSTLRPAKRRSRRRLTQATGCDARR